jgi:membrane-associated PAP2 superfamily phosphatase
VFDGTGGLGTCSARERGGRHDCPGGVVQHGALARQFVGLLSAHAVQHQGHVYPPDFGGIVHRGLALIVDAVGVKLALVEKLLEQIGVLTLDCIEKFCFSVLVDHFIEKTDPV